MRTCSGNLRNLQRVPDPPGKALSSLRNDLERAREYAGTFPDRSISIGAFLGDEMIGFVKLVTDETRTQACLVHILSMVKHKDKAPTNALIAQAVDPAPTAAFLIWCTRISPTVRSGRQPEPLQGSQRLPAHRSASLLRPVDSLGKMAFRLGLHHRLVDHFPEAVCGEASRVPEAWYNRKFHL